MFISDLLSRAPSYACLTISAALMLAAAFLVSRLTRLLRLPDVTGYLLAGIALGPYALRVIPAGVIEDLGFLTDIALACIAFGVGRYFTLARLRTTGSGVIWLTLTESLAAAVLIALSMRGLFGMSRSFSLLLGAIASATAPASTLMTIRQYKARGHFVDVLLQVVALDDAVALLAFSAAAAAAQAVENAGQVNLVSVLLPLGWNAAALALVFGAGLLLAALYARLSKTAQLLFLLSLIMTVTGLCTLCSVSPLLSCMMMGTVYVNRSGSKAAFRRLNRCSPPILVLFFTLSGMRLNLPMLASAGIIGVAYFFIRIAGKYAGACLGAAALRETPEVRRWLGAALIPQAGVSIGLAALAARMLSPGSGELLSTIILSSGVLYEMAGPACAKLALRRAGAFPVRDSAARPL